ncbi:hypothetical protein [Legionella sp. CNM-4043-24]|uniref:hypothetical protein n=1 Tax=Legionella sp. CNM-4043-24 TaxID=3421646 RepID=UPI00403AF20B
MISARLRLVQDAHDRVNREISAEAHAQETRNDIQLLSLRIQQIQTMQTAIMPAVPQNNVRGQAGENRQHPPPALPVQSHEEHAKGYYRLLLQSYINRIATHKKHGQPDRINFAHGFIFFSKSRAINREINYRLAQRLLHRLEYQTIAQVFSGNMEAVRQEIIHENRMQARSHYLQSNLSHSELNNIVKSARRI